MTHACTRQENSRYVLYRLSIGEIFIVLDREGEPAFGDLVIINSGKDERLAYYRGQSIMGVAIILKLKSAPPIPGGDLSSIN